MPLLKVMPARAFWVSAVVLGLIGSVTGWVLLSMLGGGGPQDRIRLDTIRTTASIVVGAGGAVALLLAARRQRTSELALVQSQHDALERRVTDLYSAAIEQLGSDKAPVRLGGLYALERLAQDNLDHRQTIVEVLCAYLRMPVATELSGANVTPGEGEAECERQQHGEQERRVRRTAQHILSSHLRPDADETGVATNEKFWSGIDLYLAGAVLRHWNFSGCRVRKAVFSDAVFEGAAMFDDAVFDGTANFAGAVLDHAVFYGTTFHRAALWNRAWIRDAVFTGAHFADDARFDQADLDDTDFTGARFGGSATFTRAHIDDARFDHALFRDERTISSSPSI